MFYVVLTDRPHGSCYTLFWKLVSGFRVEKSKNAAVAFTCGQQNRILGILMMSSPHSSTSGLRPLNPAMPHNNNNGRLHACVFAAEDIEPTRTKYYAPLPLHWAKRIMDNLLAIFIFFFLCSVSPSVVCLYTHTALCACSVTSSPFLVNFKRHL